MPNMGAYKPKNAYQYNNTNYDDKSSDYGHYEPEITGKRYGVDGSQAPITQMRWVEDNRSFEAPAEDAPIEVSEPTEDPAIQLSQRAAAANAGTQAYEDVLLNKQGTATIGRDLSPVQDFKNAYQNTLTEELKAKAPTTLAAKQAEIELADKQKADMVDSFELDLGTDNMQQGAGRGISFT